MPRNQPSAGLFKITDWPSKPRHGLGAGLGPPSYSAFLNKLSNAVRASLALRGS